MVSLFFLAAAIAAASPDKELSLGGVALGQSEAAVVGALGPPLSRTVGGSDYLPIRLSYAGMTLLLDEQGVGALIATADNVCTPAGACPGMRFDHLRRIYGSRWVTEQVGGAKVGYVHRDGCWLVFSQNGGRVERIEVACSP